MAKAYAPIYSKDNMELDISGIGNLEPMMDIYNSYSNCKTVNYPWLSYIPFNYEQREGRQLI